MTRVVVAVSVLAIASYSDWRTREASDLNWLFLGSVGLILIIYQLVTTNVPYGYYLFLIPLGVVFFDIFWDRRGLFEEGINLPPLILYIASALALVYLFLEFGEEELFWQLLVVLVMFVVIMLLYQFNIIKGGADAKALIALSLVFPTYPQIGEFPLIHVPYEQVMLIFPFSLLVLFNAAILSLVVPLGLLVFNTAKKDVKIPAMLLGYKMGIAEARKKFVWPMERMEGGKTRFAYFPKDDEGSEAVLDGLANAGLTRIWVTPKVPFLIFITVALLISTFIGNIVLLVLS